MRLLHPRHADRRPGPARPRRGAKPRRHPRTYFRQLLPLPRISGYSRCNRIHGTISRPGTGRKGRLTMNEHVHTPTLSERADELEEKMMNELGERVATKSVLFGMADGKIEMMSGFDFKKNNPDKFFLMGADPRLPQFQEKQAVIFFFKNCFA